MTFYAVGERQNGRRNVSFIVVVDDYRTGVVVFGAKPALFMII
jgi:hypothetical protein